MSPAAAQDSNFALVDGAGAARFAGWTFTPSLVYQGAWDDNALVVFEPEPPSDFLSIVNPRADVNFLGRRGEFDASYDGAFVLYRELNALNSYDQHASVSARRLLTPHVTVWARNGFAAVPTTELLNFVAVPFVRTGSKLEDFRSGVEVALSKYTSLTAAYNLQWVSFDETQTATLFLRGGHSHGGTAIVKHQISDATSLVGTYSLQHASLVNGGTFDVQNGDAGIEHQLLANTHVFAAFGFSHLSLSEFGAPRTGPSWRAGMTHRVQRVALTASYSRSYVPTFSFGGTSQNEELTGMAQAPLARRVALHSSVSWRRNEPLETGGLRLKTVWFETTVGYALQPWVQLQGFFSLAHQEIDRPGGIVGHNRVGFQVVTSKPMRIR
jgi:hypothetical protein